ncbi:MAG: hypothetical protein IPF55_14040 [Rhodoferax sp.]|nr:hypothetical protein [Rhodoferax sp.]
MPNPDEARQQLGELLSAGFVEMLGLQSLLRPPQQAQPKRARHRLWMSSRP